MNTLTETNESTNITNKANMPVINETKINSANVIELKKRVYEELAKPWIPDIKAIFEWECLNVIEDILNEELEKERQRFTKLLETKDEDISFEIFEDESILEYLFSLTYHFEMVSSNDITRGIIERFQDSFSELINEIMYNKRFYEMHVYCRDNNMLNKEQKRIITESIKHSEISWIHLDEDKQERLKEINTQLVKLQFAFWKNVLDSEKDFSYIFEDDSEISDIPSDTLENAKKKAEKDWKKWYKFTSDTTSYFAVMQYCKNSEIRKYFYISRQNRATEESRDNRPLILEILKLRKEKATILWYGNYAEYALQDKMVANPDEIIDLLKQIWERALKKAHTDIEEIKTYFKISDIDIWDVTYYSRILKEKVYQVSEKETKQYYEYERVLAWLLSTVNRLFDVEFVEIQEWKYHEDARVFEVRRDGKLLTYFILDPFYRESKESWAWANILRWRFNKWDKKTEMFAVNVSAYQKSENWKTLLTWWDASTMFHEMWHLLQYALSKSYHSELNWNQVEHDFVEVPSQFLENWFTERESKKLFAAHFETWETIPDDLLDRIDKLKKYLSGYSTLGQIWYSLVDMLLHVDNPPTNVEELDSKVTQILNMYAIFEIPKENKMHASLTHIFDWGYSAGLYSYLWSEIYEADIFSEFKKNGIFDKATATRYMKNILETWAIKPAKELFHDFAWRDVSLEPYFERMGF